MDTSTIVASNIPMSLFPASEIDILFKPFGTIKGIQLIPPGPSPSHPLATLAPASPLAQTVIVTFEKAADAIAAKNTLHGQVYEGFGLAVGFVSNLGKDEHQTQGNSTTLDHGFSTPALTNTTAPYCGFESGHLSSQNMPSEQAVRGLPIDPCDAMQFRYMNDFSSAHSSYSNWFPCPPFMPHALAYQPHHALNSPVPYDPAARCVIDLCHHRRRELAYGYIAFILFPAKIKIMGARILPTSTNPQRRCKHYLIK
jgi:hypothetical protein